MKCRLSTIAKVGVLACITAVALWYAVGGIYVVETEYYLRASGSVDMRMIPAYESKEEWGAISYTTAKAPYSLLIVIDNGLPAFDEGELVKLQLTNESGIELNLPVPQKKVAVTTRTTSGGVTVSCLILQAPHLVGAEFKDRTLAITSHVALTRNAKLVETRRLTAVYYRRHVRRTYPYLLYMIRRMT